MLAPTAAQKEKKRFAKLDAITLDTVTLDTKRQGETRIPPRSVLVVFHGYGATAEDLLPLAPSFAQAMHEDTRETVQVFLQAPDTCSIEGHAVGRAWFPLRLLSFEEIVSGLRQVEDSVKEALEEIRAHYAVSAQRIALFGFSQGGMVALQAACNAEHAWLATVGVATRLVLSPDLQDCAPSRSTPLMMVHGEEDEIVPFQQGLKTASLLREKGYNLTWLARPKMGHAIDETTLQSACDFLARHARHTQKEQTQAEKIL